MCIQYTCVKYSVSLEHQGHLIKKWHQVFPEERASNTWNNKVFGSKKGCVKQEEALKGTLQHTASRKNWRQSKVSTLPAENLWKWHSGNVQQWFLAGNIHVQFAIQDHNAVSTRWVDRRRNLSPTQLQQQLTSGTDQALERSNLLHKDFLLVCILTTGRVVTAVSLSSSNQESCGNISNNWRSFPIVSRHPIVLSVLIFLFGGARVNCCTVRLTCPNPWWLLATVLDRLSNRLQDPISPRNCSEMGGKHECKW